MDPEARVVVTARDATGTAFASAEKNLRGIARSALQFRSVLAGFGVVVSGRMFANWIKDAIEVEKLTKEQAAAIGSASVAVAELNGAFQDLARTAATELAPKLEHAAKFWKEFFFPSTGSFGAGADAIREQVDAQIVEVERLQRLLGTQTSYAANQNWFDRMLFGDQGGNIAETTSQLAGARAELERLRTALLGAQNGDNSRAMPLPTITPSELAALEEAVTLMNLPQNMASQAEWVQLEENIFNMMEGLRESAVEAAKLDAELQEISGAVVKMPADLKQLSPEFNSFAASLAKPLEKIKDESAEFAEEMGANFRYAFSGWILDAERSFSDLLKRMAVEMATSALFKGAASLFPGGSFFSSFFGGARAEGGPVSSGKGYLVGERGPEMFFPGQSGMIAAGAGGSSFNITTNIDARGADPSVAARLPAILAENNRRLMGEIKDKQRRGRF